MKKLIIFLLLFVFSFGLYLYSAPPGLVAYRDAGEMVTISKTLGIAHSPGYPLYTLLGKLASLFPLGNIGYRINLISIISGALTISLCFLCLSYLIDLGSALITALFLCSTYLFWYLSVVQEMYSLNALFAVLLIYIVIGHQLSVIGYRNFYLFSFLFGLGLGNRLDLVLVLPGFFYLLLKTHYQKSTPRSSLFALRSSFLVPRSLFFALCFFTLGFSVYLYLPVRSGTAPLLDWNHPANLERLWATISRKTHGGTLDLLSRGYSAGENFLPSILFYFRHLAKEFFYIGLPLGIFGLYSLSRKNRSLAVATFIVYLISGPFFIYLGNLPPNPHALAILEAHFLLPNLFFLLWMGVGIYSLGRRAKFLILPFLILNFISHYPQVNKRNNFFVLDYSRNLFSTLEPNSIIIAREDVQLFSLWERQIVRGKRPDLTVIAQGLSASPWYEEQIKRWYPGRKIFLTNLKEADALNQFFSYYQQNIFFSNDCELPGEEKLKLNVIPQGLVSRFGLSPGTNLPAEEGYSTLHEFYFYRGRYNYQDYCDFFTPDLIEEYAKGYQQLGFFYLKNGKYNLAEKNFYYALSMQVDFPVVYSTLGYLYFAQNRLSEAEKMYHYSIIAYLDLYSKAREYRSFPEVRESIKFDLANAYNNLGVVCERLGKEIEALNLYEKALGYNPVHIDAQFNIAVVHWKKGDWEKVITALENVLRMNPQHQAARNYLILAREKLR